MAEGTVIVLPSSDDRHAALLDQFLLVSPAAQVVLLEASVTGSRSARTCLAIADLAPASPIMVVAFGDAAGLLPHVAVAQRAAHRRVAEYILVDPDLPSVNDSWPDSLVTVFCEAAAPASLESRLRGWTVHPTDALLAWTPDDP